MVQRRNTQTNKSFVELLPSPLTILEMEMVAEECAASAIFGYCEAERTFSQKHHPDYRENNTAREIV